MSKVNFQNISQQLHAEVKEMQPRSEKLAYTILEATEVIGLGKNFIYELINTGQIGFIRRGKNGTKRVIPRFELERYMRENLEFAELSRFSRG